MRTPAHRGANYHLGSQGELNLQRVFCIWGPERPEEAGSTKGEVRDELNTWQKVKAEGEGRSRAPRPPGSQLGLGLFWLGVSLLPPLPPGFLSNISSPGGFLFSPPSYLRIRPMQRRKE